MNPRGRGRYKVVTKEKVNIVAKKLEPYNVICIYRKTHQ